MSSNFFVDRSTVTSADSLLAFGVAYFLRRLTPEDEDSGLRLTNQGDCYLLTLNIDLDNEQAQQPGFFTLLPGLETLKKKVNVPDKVDYADHQERNKAYFEARKRKLDQNQLTEQGLTPPHPDWPIWSLISQMSATDAYNGLVELWYAHRACFPELTSIILGMFRQRPNDIEVAEEAWLKLAQRHGIDVKLCEASRLQVINPGMGKGGNKSKASGLNIGGLGGFWVLEYLKFVGLYQAGLPRVVRESKDRKTYVLQPKSLLWRTHNRVLPGFRGSLYAASAIQMDILAVLRYCKVFLEQWKAGQHASGRRFASGRPGDHVEALEATFYKHLGSAHATMNTSTLRLPNWLNEVTTVAQATQFSELLTEHETIVRNLNEKHSQEYELLRNYRDFLSAHDLRSFFRFTGAYAEYVMAQLAKAPYPPRRFHVPNLGVLIMAHNPNLARIVQNQGFRRISEAIRSSTVIPQYFKSINQPGPYEIRYGLGNELLRRAAYPEQFAQALAKFIFAYSQENAQINERYDGNPPVRRLLVRTEDLEQVLALMHEFEDSETVANLLVAFGYAHDPKDPKTKSLGGSNAGQSQTAPGEDMGSDEEDGEGDAE